MNSRLQALLANCEEVTDAEEGRQIFLKYQSNGDHKSFINSSSPEAFLLFSQDIPTGNLGFVEPRSATVDVTIRGDEYTIHQSPTLLSSTRAGGTTGAG
ncbi:hypothetical protein VI817_000708 [Penicillium citrinum]|nr:hypothetical protein VI817_000708 [Penicillium citrinum]